MLRLLVNHHTSSDVYPFMKPNPEFFYGEGLRIAVDAKRALRNTTGLGNYSRCLIDSLASLPIANQLLLLSTPDADTRLVNSLLDSRTVSLEAGQGPGARLLHAYWRSYGISSDIRRLRPDVYHGLSNELPLNIASAGVPSVVTVHDVIWRRFPSDYKAVDRRLYDLKYGRSARNATRVIAISECTARDLAGDFGIPRDKIDVVYQDCDWSFTRASAEDIARVRSAYGIGDNPYVVAVGTVQGRKNQLLAVKGLRALPADVRLVIVGRRTAYAREIDAYIASHPELRDRVLWLEGVPFADLPALYSGAVFSSYTSRYEGFGIPLVESLRCRVPVIAATGSCLEEAGGPGAFYIDPDSEEQWAEYARRLLDDSELRNTMAREGYSHTGIFGGKNFACGTMDSYRRAIAEFNK